MRQLFLAPPEAETTTLTLVGQIRGTALRGRAREREPPPPPAATATATAGPPMRGARCVGCILGSTLAEVLAHTGGRQAGRASSRGERAHQVRTILGALAHAKTAVAAGGGGADCAGLALGLGSLCAVRTQRDEIDAALPRPSHHADELDAADDASAPTRKRRRRVRLDSAYGNLAAGLGCTAALLAALSVLTEGRPGNAVHFCKDASVRKVLRSAALQLAEWERCPHLGASRGGLEALGVELRAMRRAADAAAASPAWDDGAPEGGCAAHVRAELACAVRAAYPMPEATPATPAAAAAAPLCVVPLSEIADPRLLLVYSGAADDDDEDSSDEDGSRGRGRSVRSARTSRTSGSGASVGSTASGLAEAFVDCLLPS